MFGLTAALAYGEIMGQAARQGHAMTAPDAMLAAIARVNGARLATRNLDDLEMTGPGLLNPRDF
ncbi:Plasmid stabilization protein (fragment) [Rhizobium mesoamericanum STM3625]|uniref:Plasmid stabilization protein n=1 Tax=Rhizobium mesoamericanum STM3625 TaxID=1211777 RepID=K0Q370_9HYPH